MQLLPGDADAACLPILLNVQHATVMSSISLHIKSLLRARRDTIAVADAPILAVIHHKSASTYKGS